MTSVYYFNPEIIKVGLYA